MDNYQEALKEFHRKIYGSDLGRPKGKRMPKKIALLRLRLIVSEVGELADAIAKDDRVEIADALGDLLYVTFGTFLVYGLPADKIFKEIHRSNLTKQVRKKISKGAKGAAKGSSFEPPRLEQFI